MIDTNKTGPATTTGELWNVLKLEGIAGTLYPNGKRTMNFRPLNLSQYPIFKINFGFTKKAQEQIEKLGTRPITGRLVLVEIPEHNGINRSVRELHLLTMSKKWNLEYVQVEPTKGVQ